MYRYLFFDSDDNFTNSVEYVKPLPEPLVGCIEDYDSDVNLTYHSNGVAVDKSPMNLTVDKTTIDSDGVDKAVITGIPIGTHVDDIGTINDGSLEILSEFVQTITLKFICAKYLPKEITIDAI